MTAYRYTESGLDNVFIEGANVLIDDSGEPCVTIPNVNGLHKAIAYGIVHRRSAMVGRELRFLRTELGMNQPSSPHLCTENPWRSVDGSGARSKLTAMQKRSSDCLRQSDLARRLRSPKSQGGAFRPPKPHHLLSMDQTRIITGLSLRLEVETEQGRTR